MKIFIIIKHNSQRIKKKNFLNINGFPLWEFFLKKFKKKDQVYIDTDSSEVFNSGKIKFKNFIFYKREKKFIDYENRGVKSPVLMMIKNFLLKHVDNDNEIILSTDKGRVIRCAVIEIRSGGRNTQGVRIFKLSGEEKVVSAIKVEDNLI